MYTVHRLCEQYQSQFNSLSPGKGGCYLRLVIIKLISRIDILSIYGEIILTDGYSTLLRWWPDAITWISVDQHLCGHVPWFNTAAKIYFWGWHEPTCHTMPICVMSQEVRELETMVQCIDVHTEYMYNIVKERLKLHWCHKAGTRISMSWMVDILESSTGTASLQEMSSGKRNIQTYPIWSMVHVHYNTDNLLKTWLENINENEQAQEKEIGIFFLKCLYKWS